MQLITAVPSAIAEEKLLCSSDIPERPWYSRLSVWCPFVTATIVHVDLHGFSGRGFSDIGQEFTKWRVILRGHSYPAGDVLERFIREGMVGNYVRADLLGYRRNRKEG